MVRNVPRRSLCDHAAVSSSRLSYSLPYPSSSARPLRSLPLLPPPPALEPRSRSRRLPTIRSMHRAPQCTSLLRYTITPPSPALTPPVHSRPTSFSPTPPVSPSGVRAGLVDAPHLALTTSSTAPSQRGPRTAIGSPGISGPVIPI